MRPSEDFSLVLPFPLLREGRRWPSACSGRPASASPSAAAGLGRCPPSRHRGVRGNASFLWLGEECLGLKRGPAEA